MEELITVVIPTYNVEKFLDRCVNSVVKQTYCNLEIILVNDGSTDTSPEKCDQWAKMDKRISVIHKKNAGLGMARNTGIEHAKGHYICFFDSDDYIDKNTIEHALALAKEEQADLVVFGMSSVERNGDVIRSFIPESEKTCYRGNEITDDFLPSVIQRSLPGAKTKNLNLSACMCLFSMGLISRTGWNFVSEREIISEDIYSLLALYKHVEAVAVLRESLYYYCENDSSLTHSYRSDRFARNKHFYQKCLELCDACGYPSKVKKSCMSPFLGNTMAAMKQEVEFHSNKRDAIKALREIMDDVLLQTVLQSKKKDPVKLKNRILFWAMRHKAYHLCYALLLTKNSVKNKVKNQ